MGTAYVMTELRRVDPDRYLLSLFTPRAVRPAVQALFLLRHEISRTRSMVTDTNLGLIRLQWWRDEIGKLYDGGGGGEIPVLSTLAPLIHQQVLPQDLFDTMIYAHEFDLEDVPPANLDGLKKYAGFTTVPLTRLALKIVVEEDSDEAIEKISQNFAILNIIRSVPLSLSQGQCLLPGDLLARRNLSSQKIMDFNYKAEVVNVIKEAVTLIAPYRKPNSRLLSKMRRMNNIYLDQLEKIDFDVFSAEAQMQAPFLALRLALG